MSRSNTRSKSKPSSTRKLGVQPLEDRRLMAADVFGAGDLTPSGPSPATTEHILLAPQVGVPQSGQSGGGDGAKMCKSEGTTVETACDVLGPGVDPDAGSDGSTRGRFGSRNHGASSTNEEAANPMDLKRGLGDLDPRSVDAAFAANGNVDDVAPVPNQHRNIGFIAIR